MPFLAGPDVPRLHPELRKMAGSGHSTTTRTTLQLQLQAFHTRLLRARWAGSGCFRHGGGWLGTFVFASRSLMVSFTRLMQTNHTEQVRVPRSSKRFANSGICLNWLAEVRFGWRPRRAATRSTCRQLGVGSTPTRAKTPNKPHHGSEGKHFSTSNEISHSDCPRRC